MSDKERLQSHIQKKLSLSIMEIIPQSFDIFKKAPLQYVLLLLSIIGISFIGLLVGAFNIFLLVAIILVFTFAFLPGIQVGVGHFSKKTQENKEVQFSDFFIGFKINFKQLVVQAILVTVIILAVTILPNLNYYQEYYLMLLEVVEYPEEAMSIFMNFSESHQGFNLVEVLANLFSFYFAIILSLTPYLVSFFKVNAITALDISIRTMNKVIFQAAAIRIAFSFFIIIGAFMFGIGLFIAIPLFLIGIYLVFNSLFGELLQDNHDSNADILNHLQ